MRKYKFRKQTREDFARRVASVDPHARGVFGRGGTDITPRRPFTSLLVGFGWIYMVVGVTNNRDRIEASLSQGSLTGDMQHMIVTGLIAGLMISGVLLVIHLARAITHGGTRRSNSRRFLAGAACACAIIYTPPEVFNLGLEMLDGNSRQLLEVAQARVLETVPGVDLSSIALVSSQWQ